MHRIFSNFEYILLLGMSGMGLLMGKIRPFSMELLPFLPLKNGFWPVIFYCLWYLNETSQICWTAQVTYYNEGPSLLPFQFMSYPPLINLENVFDLKFLYYMKYLNETSQICWHIVTKDVISLSISVLLLLSHYISHKITFGAPSSGGVLCSACGAFICFTGHTTLI